MKNYIVLAFASLFTLPLFSQSDQLVIPMQYSFMLEDVPDTLLRYRYEPGKSFVETRLTTAEMDRYRSAFLDYIEKNAPVNNYVGKTGTEPPTSLGPFTFEKALKARWESDVNKVGGMHMKLNYGCTLRVKKDTIFENDRPMLAEGYLLFGRDTTYTENLMTGEMVAEVRNLDVRYHQRAGAAGFTEEWSFDKRKNTFNKEVKYMSVLIPVFDAFESKLRGYKYIFTLKSGKLGSKYEKEGLLRKNMETVVLFNRDFYPNRDGITHYGMARTSEAEGYIEPTFRYDLLLDVLANVKEGLLKVYEYDEATFDPNNLKLASNFDYFKRLEWSDTVSMTDLLTGEETEIVVKMEHHLHDVVGIRFFEDWYLDPETLAMKKQVNGIVLLMEDRDGFTGEPIGLMPVTPFYIKMQP